MRNKPKKIAWVSDAVMPFNKGGKEARIFHLTNELAKAGYEVHIYTMKWWTSKGDYQANGVQFHALSKLYPLYAGERRSMKQAVLFALSCLKLITRDFDILEVDHMPFFPLYACKIVSILKRRPMYATWHEVWGKAYWCEYLGNTKGTIAYWIDRFSIKLPNHITAVSALTAQRLKEVMDYRGPLTIIENGISYERLTQTKPSSNTSDIIYVGRLLTHKNVHLLVEAIALLKKSHPNVRCLIVGSGPEHDALRKQIAEKRLGKNVAMLGFVESNDDVYALMKGSKIFVLPSIREGFGISLLEAFACGLSAVTVEHEDNAARHLIAQGDGIVCEPAAQDIAAAIDTLLQSRRKKNTAKAIAEYDWSHAAHKLDEVYCS